MTCKSIISLSNSFLNAAGFFRRNARSEGAAEGGCGGNSAAPERSAERSEAGQCRFRFLDLCIRFGKMISKVCEGFNSGANKLDTNSFFEDESVRSPSPANGGAGLRSGGTLGRGGIPPTPPFRRALASGISAKKFGG